MKNESNEVNTAKNSKGESKKQKTALSKNTKLGIVLISFLAVLIFGVNLITASFSWFEPTPVSGDVIKIEEASVPLRLEKCKISDVFVGTQQKDGSISYTETSGAQSIAGKTRAFFKTVITNESEDYATNVSLFIAAFPETNANVSIAVTYPSNTYRTYSEKQTDLSIIRNATISNRVQGNAASGKLEVEWFVDNKSDSNISVDLSKLYVMYN